MKPARRTKKAQARPEDILDLSGSQTTDTKHPPSSPPPTRIGHLRSYSSPTGSDIGGAAAATEDGEDSDFAFDKMTSSEDEEEYNPSQAVDVVVRKPPKKKRAVEGRSSAAATPARKPKKAGGGRGQSGGRGRGRGRGSGSGKATASSRTTPKKVTKKVSKAEALDSEGDTDGEVGSVKSRSVMRRSAGKKVVMRGINDSDDDDEGNSTSSKEQGNDSDWEFEESGGGKGKGVGKGRPRKERGDSNGTAGASRKRALSLAKGKRGDSVQGLSDESDEGEEFFVGDEGKDKPSGGDTIGTTSSVEEESVGSQDSGIINLLELERSPSTGSKIKSASGASGSAVSGKEEKRLRKASDSPSINADTSTPVATAGGKGKSKGGKDKGKAKAIKKDVLSTAKPAKLAGDVEVVLRRLRRLRDKMEGAGEEAGRVSGRRGDAADGEGGWDGKKAQTLLELGLGGDVTEVKEMDSAGVMDEIERIIVETAMSIMGGKGFGFRVPTRSSGNQKYVEKLDRIVLGDKISQRNFVSTAMARKTAITTRVIQLVHQVLGKGIHITKRDMFYTDVKLFREQGESDTVLDDVACMVGCTRSCLNVVASDKGLVVGRVTFLEDGDMIDCTRMGVGGKAIPPYIDKITDIKSDADFILLVEKEAAYMRLAEDRFYQKYPCIVITAKGQPDVATRLFLKRLKRELNIPVMGLVDSDPYGLKILSVYMSGSKNMSYDSASLTTPDIKWLGVRPSDLDRYNIPEQCRLDMTDHDIKTGKELLQEDFIKKSSSWCRELELMIKTKKKAEIQSLSAFGFQYLTHTYLPQKLQNGDWV